MVAGRPNVGKSSLINALLGYPRSIVHPTAGTTRDVVTAATAIDGWPVLLADTAGLGVGGDAVERAGIALAHQQMAQADLIVLLFDLSVPWTAADDALLADWPEAMVVHNKSDAALSGETARPPGLAVMRLTRRGWTCWSSRSAIVWSPTRPPRRGRAVYRRAGGDIAGDGGERS